MVVDVVHGNKDSAWWQRWYVVAEVVHGVGGSEGVHGSRGSA